MPLEIALGAEQAVSASVAPPLALNGGRSPCAQVAAAPTGPAASELPATATDKPSFDAVVEGNLRRGLYRSQRDAMVDAARDPRCTRSHILVLAIIVTFMNSATAMAFPGWRTIAKMMATFPGAVPDPGGPYSDSTVNNLLSDLRRWGYLASTKRGPEGGGRAVAHYTVARPSVEQLREEITKYITEGRARAQKERDRVEAFLDARNADLPGSEDVADILTPKEVSGASDLPGGGEVRSSDLLGGRAADLLGGRVTVTCNKREPVEEAVDAYNEAAEKHGFTACCPTPDGRTLTDVRRKKLEKRLKDIGGVDAFKLALTALPRDKFLMGKVPPKANQTPFKLDIDKLMQTDGTMGDVLARLIDAAGDAAQRESAKAAASARLLADLEEARRIDKEMAKRANH